jgi:hypothetical protein
MNAEQPELISAAPLPPLPPVKLPDDPDARLLITILLQRQHWTTAAVIIEQVFRETARRWSERLVRKLAKESSPEIISGQDGYLLIGNASAEEVRHFYNWMHSQADEMKHRAEAIKQRRPEAFKD